MKAIVVDRDYGSVTPQEIAVVQKAYEEAVKVADEVANMIKK